MTKFQTFYVACLVLLLGVAASVSAQEAQGDVRLATKIIDQDTLGCEAGDAYHQVCYKLPKAFDIKFVAMSFDDVLPGGYTLERLIASNFDNPQWQGANEDTVLAAGIFFRVK